MTHRYTFSFYRSEPRAYIVHHPWYMFWKKPELKYHTHYARYVYCFSDEDAAKLITAASDKNWATGPGRLFKFLMGNASYVQLEQGTSSTTYVATQSYK